MLLVRIVTDPDEAATYRYALPGTAKAKSWEVRDPNGVWIGIFVFDTPLKESEVAEKFREVYGTEGWDLQPVTLKP